MMNRKDISGIIPLIIICCLAISCSLTRHVRDYNYLTRTNFYNDTINFYTQFAADIKFEPIEKRQLKKRIKGIKELNYQDFLIYGKTFIAPYYEIMLFYNENNTAHLSQDTTQLVFKNPTEEQILYKRTKGKKTAYLFLQGKNAHFSNLKSDGESMIKSVQFNFPVQKELNYWQVFNDYQGINNILFLQNKIENAPIEKNRQNEWAKFQVLATILSKEPTDKGFKSLIYNAEQSKKKYFQSKIDSILKTDKTTLSSKLKVLRKIKNLSKDKRVVMLNERHWFPKDRIWASKMLAPLKENGFNYLAVEAVSKEKDSILNKRGFPVNSTGYYTREPYFGLFLRKAHQLGFKIVGYDDLSTDNREKAQAQKITEILENNPEAKIFVYAGEDHIYEKNSKTKRMAEYFKEISNIDPLTFNQVQLSANAKDDVILFKSQSFSKYSRVKNTVDYFILNNIVPNINDFYPVNQLKNTVLTIPELKKYKNQNVFVSVYFLNEFDLYKESCVPLKDKIYKPKNKKIELKLPVGKYHLNISNDENEKIISKQIRVD